jgi:tRNA pseudouridine32 synthase/23S rRNA pseudouridine746 synthase
VHDAVTYFDPQPSPGDLPARLASPFASDPPHALAQRAADELVRRLAAGDFGAAALAAPGGGKMFGVLVVAARDGRIGYLRGFSGMLGGRWIVDGFVPPLFDEAARDAIWPEGEAALAALEADHRAMLDEAAPLRAAMAALDARHADEVAALRARHAVRRARRRDERARLDPAAPSSAARRRALDHASRADTAERRRLDAAHAEARAALATRLAALDLRRAELAARRADRSRALWQALLDTYVVANARGARRSLHELFAPIVPPGGAGDCAAPKLVGAAHRLGLRPLALAELWWGAPPSTGGRRAGQFYPACRGKCGPILPFMLEGLPVDDAPRWGDAPLGPELPRVVFEDPWLIVVDKPCGMLSVPGRHARLRDSVATRLRARWPDATGPLIVHRLDLDTSGLLLAAKDPDTHAALQQRFARREVDKRYVAWLDGVVARDAGVIELALRVDLDDRPRQIHDPVHGKPARTEFRVTDRAADRTRVALYPRTGRTHQLRVHAAHPDGLGAPIVGDRLYGRAADRLMLHAEALGFVHPHTGARVDLVVGAPF